MFYCNKVIKKTERVPFIAFCFLFFAPYLAAEPLKVGLTNYPPHVYEYSGEVTGNVRQYLELAFKDEFSSVSFTLLPSKRARRELKKGNIDVLFPYIEQGEHLPKLENPILHVLPGLCFKKQNFIPILSAPGAMDGLDVGVPATLPLVPTFSLSSVNIKVIEGSDVLQRGIQLLLRDRIDAFYHPSPVNVYHYKNPLSKSIACSLFYGFSRPVYLGISPLLSKQAGKAISKAFNGKMKERPYEYFIIGK